MKYKFNKNNCLCSNSGVHFGCPFPFDRMGGALAHSLPSGAIHLDDEEPWKADNGQDGINLLKVSCDCRFLLSLHKSDSN